MTEEFITYLGRDARVLRTEHYLRFDAMLVQSMGEPFYTEYAAEDGSTYGLYEQITWAYFPKPAAVTVETQPDDLPIPADPGVDEVIEVYESMYAHVNDMRAGVA